jgi:hypothetical protein
VTLEHSIQLIDSEHGSALCVFPGRSVVVIEIETWGDGEERRRHRMELEPSEVAEFCSELRKIARRAEERGRDEK